MTPRVIWFSEGPLDKLRRVLDVDTLPEEILEEIDGEHHRYIRTGFSHGVAGNNMAGYVSAPEAKPT